MSVMLFQGMLKNCINVQLLLNVVVGLAIGLRTGGFGVQIPAKARFFLIK